MEESITNLVSQPATLIPLIGYTAYTTLCTICSAMSKVLPDTITKGSMFLGMRIGKLRGPYNKVMKFANKIAFNSGKAANNPNAQ